MYKTTYGIFNGDSWEDFCQQCFKLKYESEGYQEMPAWQGDLGIEGFTRTGIVFQCYCPDSDYNPDKLYEEQRDKITKDVEKIIKNELELSKYLNGEKIKKWIFVVPEYKKKDIVKHCQDKAREYRGKKSNIIDTDFDILIYDIEFFIEQIPLVLQFRNEKLDIISKEQKTKEEIADWKSKSISLVDNAITKHKQRLSATAKHVDNKVNLLTEISISNFLNGDLMIRIWAEKYQDQYEKFQTVVSQFELKVEEMCAVNSGNNDELYKQIEKELRGKITNSFGFLDEAMIDRLTNRVMADWILRCPIKFD